MLITPDIRDQAYRLFIEEVPELLQIIEEGLLSLKQERTNERIHELMRAAHSLKGGAACLEFEAIKTIAHRLEDVFRALYSQSIEVDTELESLLLQAYDCLRLPLMQQITLASFDSESALSTANPVFNLIEQRLGDALATVDRYIPSSSDLGIDLVLSIFEVDVAQGLERLATVIANPQEYEVAGELRAQAEVFAGFAELLGLEGFWAIAQAAQKALFAHPEQAVYIAQLALADFQVGRQAVLSGDRTQGGSPSTALAALSLEDPGEIAIDAVTKPSNKQSFDREETFSLEELLVSNEQTVITSSDIPQGIIFPSECDDFEAFNDTNDQSSQKQDETHAQRPHHTPAVSTRVELSRLERMHKLVGEMIIHRNALALENEQVQDSAQELLRRFSHFQEIVSLLRNVSDATLTAQERSSPYPAPSVFDSLEMDKYGVLHSLVQSILEEVVQLEEAVEDVALFAEQSGQKLDQKRQMLTQLQDELKWARMLPLGEVLNRFPRMLRDLSACYHKPVNLKLKGTEVQVEKAILEKLYDPMLQLLRNAFDHGIESPEIRRQLSKPETGEIEIRAYYQGNQTVIEVRDDGWGINLERIRSRAIELGWLSAAEVASTTNERLLELIFEPGFSTARHVSELSGRGVGLDVARAQLRSLKGSITVTSSSGQGTTFTLRLPLSLTIAKLFVASADFATVALPADSVEGIVTPQKDRIKRIGAQSFLLWQEQLIPIYQLATLLSYNCPLPDTADQKSPTGNASQEKELPLLLLRRNGELFALLVDQLLTEQELVIKPFACAIAPPKYAYGCTMLGDGSLIPVIDGAALLEQALEQNARTTAPPQFESIATSIKKQLLPNQTIVHKAQTPTALVIDDSTTMRQTLALSLQRAGYRVLQARNGWEAMEKLQQSPVVQLVLCDIEMPKMNGFEFLEKRRQNPQLCKIPTVMLTSRSNDKHRQLAMTLGAAAYFTKPYIELEFLETLKNIAESSISRILPPAA